MTCLGHISAKLVDLARICSDVTITGKDAAMDVKTEYTVVMVPGPNLLAVARHKECVHVAGRLCAKCYLLSKAAMIKRSDRARGYADSIVAATALLRGEPVPASIISRYIKSEKYVNEPDAGIALRLLKEKIKGRNERTLSPNFVLERALVLATIANFELVDAHCDSPGYKVDPKYRDFIKKFILQVEKNGFAGRHVGSFFWDFVNGTIDMKSAAVGVVVSAAQVVKKMRANATNMRGIKHTEGFMNLMANCKRWGARCVEGVSKHIIGYQVPPSTVNRALKKMLGTDKFIEVIHPSAEDLDELCALLHRGHGSEREIVAVAMDATKRNFGNLRYKINSPGVLEMATRWLFRVTMSSLEAAGKVATVSHRKGYSASGPKTVHPSCNELVDKPTCIALMYEIDQVAVDFMWKRFGCPTNASAGPPGAPTDAGAHGAPVDSEGIPLVDDNAMEPDSLAYDPDSDAMHETISFNPAGPLMAQEMSETEMQVMNITIDEIEDVELDLSQLDAAEKTYLAAEEAEKENPAPAPAEAEGTVDPQTAALGRARGWLDGMRAAGECENEREAAKIFIELRKTADRAPPTTAAVLSAPAAARRKSVLFNVNGQPVDVASIVKERYAKTEAESKAQQNKARLDRWQKQSKVFANNKYISNIDTDVAPGHVFIVSHSADEVGLALITGVFQKYQGGFKPFASLPLREVHIVQLKMFAADSADVENQWTWTRVADGVRVYRCAQQLMARVGPLEDSFVFKPGGLASFEIGLLDLTDLQVYRGKAEAYWNAVVAPTQAGGAEDACLPAADAE